MFSAFWRVIKIGAGSDMNHSWQAGHATADRWNPVSRAVRFCAYVLEGLAILLLCMLLLLLSNADRLAGVL
jgi:hypothetical protein